MLGTAGSPRLAYSGTQRGSLLVADSDEVGIPSRKYAMLRVQALSPEESRACWVVCWENNGSCARGSGSADGGGRAARVAKSALVRPPYVSMTR
nr:hypothetical protein [Streptomyces sp. NBC_00236]